MSKQGSRWVRGVAVTVLVLGVGTLATAAGSRPAAPVPPTQEIEILDPGVDPTGKPAVLVRPGMNGLQQVEIPPAVIVHRFYYTGDRTFQGPMLPGGPVIIAVNHPKTGERVYVPLTMPPGAPRVTYTGRTIRYDYGPQSVTLTFGICGKPTVSYSQGTIAGDRLRQFGSGIRELPDTFKSWLPDVLKAKPKPDPDFTFVPRKP